MHGLTKNGYHYIRNGDGREELFDLGSDPTEQKDLSRSPNGGPALEQFRNALQTVLPSSAIAK
jgi:hypothetical protein